MALAAFSVAVACGGPTTGDANDRHAGPGAGGSWYGGGDSDSGSTTSPPSTGVTGGGGLAAVADAGSARVADSGLVPDVGALPVMDASYDAGQGSGDGCARDAGSVWDGCEVDIRSGPSNCGTCGYSCAHGDSYAVGEVRDAVSTATKFRTASGLGRSIALHPRTRNFSRSSAPSASCAPLRLPLLRSCLIARSVSASFGFSEWPIIATATRPRNPGPLCRGALW